MSPEIAVLTERLETLKAENIARKAEIDAHRVEIRAVADRQIRHEVEINAPDGLREQVRALRDELEEVKDTLHGELRNLRGDIEEKFDKATRSSNRLAWAMVAAAIAFAFDVARGGLL